PDRLPERWELNRQIHHGDQENRDKNLNHFVHLILLLWAGAPGDRDPHWPFWSYHRGSPAGALHWRATTFAPPWKGRSPNSLPIVVASTLWRGAGDQRARWRGPRAEILSGTNALWAFCAGHSVRNLWRAITSSYSTKV